MYDVAFDRGALDGTLVKDDIEVPRNTSSVLERLEYQKRTHRLLMSSLSHFFPSIDFVSGVFFFGDNLACKIEPVKIICPLVVPLPVFAVNPRLKFGEKVIRLPRTSGIGGMSAYTTYFGLSHFEGL